MNAAAKNRRSPPGSPLLSIVTPAYNEATNIRPLCDQLMRVLPTLDLPWEVIITDDGSSDGTWNEIRTLHKRDQRIKGIRLSRNFGHQYALLAGLSHAVGDAVIVMDADLQHPPQIVPQLVAEWQRGMKIVHTIRHDADVSLFKRFTSRMFYKLFSTLSGVRVERGMADFRLLDRQVVDNILEFREGGLFLRGIVQWVGYPSSEIRFAAQNRLSGTSKYTLRKMVKFAVSAVTSFSLVPLRIGIFIGIFTSVLAFGALVFAVWARLFTERAVPGWASGVSIVSFLFGVLFILVGLVGEYIGRILVEVKDRPRFLISELTGLDEWE